jgi:hypothetical protein
MKAVRWRRWNLILSAAAALGPMFSTGTSALAAPGARADARPDVTLVPDGLRIEWSAAPPQIAARADGAIQIDIPGFARLRRPGQPALPFASALIALPPDGAPKLQLLSSTESELTLPGPVAVAPAPSGAQSDEAGNLIGGAFAPAEVEGEGPMSPIELTEIGTARGVRLARLTFYPVHRSGAGWRFTPRVQIALTFGAPARAASLAGERDPLLASIQSSVLNPDQVQPIAPAGSAQPMSAPGAPVAAAVEVSAPGITALTHESLAAASFPLGGDPAHLHLTRAGAEVAMQWDGDADAAFEPGERLLFYAEPRFSRWTASDVYFLSADSASGLRMTTRPALNGAPPAGSAWMTQTAETNLLYTPQCYCGPLPPGRDGDRWTWDDVRRPDRASASYALSLPTVDVTRPATLTVWLIGYTDVAAAPDHRVDVSLNGAALGSAQWDGKQAITATLPIAPGLLTSGVNTVTLALPGLPGAAVEGAWLDAFSIQYARGAGATGNAVIFGGDSSPHTYSLALADALGLRAYDVTNPDQPVALTGVPLNGSAFTVSDDMSGGRRYAAASGAGVLSPANVRLIRALGGITGAQYLIISHPDFIPALAGLIALRQSQGLTTAVEDVRAIYDAFGGGRPDPAAIRAYLDDAYHTWSPRPTYVVLVGDGTFDPRQYRASSSATFIPPYLADVDPWMGETAADNRFAAVEGDDALPDMLLGRLPVNTLAEAQTAAGKIVQYETQPWPGGWNGELLFAADDADAAGDFAADSEQLIAAHVSAPFTARRAYFQPPAAPTAFLQSLLNSWNSGAGLIVYSGHSSIHQWAAERLFHNDDLAALTNGPRLPVVLEMTCFTGAFHDPGSATLDEALLRHPSGGAAAVWGATGLGVATGHAELASGFLRAVYVNGQPGLGEAALAGKLALAASGQNLDLLDTFTLLGDPALRVDLALAPWAYSLYLPLVQR